MKERAMEAVQQRTANLVTILGHKESLGVAGRDLRRKRRVEDYCLR